MNKDLFYKNIQPYIELGMVREVCSTKHLTLISLGEKVYVACPHILAENDYTIGIYMSPKVIKKLIKKDKDIYPVINVIFNNIEEKGNLLYHFSVDKIDFWKQWLIDNKDVNKMDYQMEEEIIEMNRRKLR